MHHQTITPSIRTVTASPGESFDLTVSYTSDSNTLTGLGLKIFFDAKKLEFQGFKSAFPQGRLATDLQQKTSVDEVNQDEDPATTHFIHQAWFSVNGQWPGDRGMPLNLCTLSFSLADDFSAVSNINFVGEAAENAVFEAQSVSIEARQVKPSSWLTKVVNIVQSFLNKLFENRKP